MRDEIIAQLNQINTDFYANTAEYFSNTRQYSWEGWDKLWTYFSEHGFQPKDILDVGCGNGRFVSFLEEKLNSFNYTGFDSSHSLLDIAKKSHKGMNIQFHQADLLSETSYPKESKYDLIVLFGVMHHVPGYSSRVKLVNKLKSQLKPGGFIVISVWDFLKQERFKNKLVPWEKLNINDRDVEENDYLMNWDKGILAYRYTHYTSEAEMQRILKDTSSTSAHSYLADGQSKDLNRYYLLQ